MPGTYQIPEKPSIHRRLKEVDISMFSEDEPEIFNKRSHHFRWRQPFYDGWKRAIRNSLLAAALIMAAFVYVLYNIMTSIVLGEEGTLFERLLNYFTRLLLLCFASTDWAVNLSATIVFAPVWLLTTFVILPIYRLVTQPVEPDLEKKIVKYHEALSTLQQKLAVDRAIFETKMTSDLTDEENERVNAVLYRNIYDAAYPAKDEPKVLERVVKSSIPTWIESLEEKVNAALGSLRLTKEQRHLWRQRWKVRGKLSWELATTYWQRHRNKEKKDAKESDWETFESDATDCAKLIWFDLKDEWNYTRGALKDEYETWVKPSHLPASR